MSLLHASQIQLLNPCLLYMKTYVLIVLGPPFSSLLAYPLCQIDSQIEVHMKPAADSQGKQTRPIFSLQTYQT